VRAKLSRGKAMRKEVFVPGNFIHIYNRGNKKAAIFKDENDYWRFLKTLFYFNDSYAPKNILREIDFIIKTGKCGKFEWPAAWPQRKPLVRLLAYCLMPNHFHLLLQEIDFGGTSNFMHRLGTAQTNYFNIKYKEDGRLFQGTYKSKIVEDIGYLQYLGCYIQVLNPFELFKGGIEASLNNFDQAFEAAVDYPFSSLGESIGVRKIGIIDSSDFKKMFEKTENYKKFSMDALIRRNNRSYIGELAID
jgi:putative transposase